MKDKLFNLICDSFTFSYENLSPEEFRELNVSVLRLVINNIILLLSEK